MDFVEDLLVNGTTQKLTLGETTVEISRELFVGALFTLLALAVFVALTCAHNSRTKAGEDGDGQEKSVGHSDLNETLQAPPTGEVTGDEGATLRHGTGEGQVEGATPTRPAKSSARTDRSPSYKYDDRHSDNGEQGEQEEEAVPAPVPTTPKRRRGRKPKSAAPKEAASGGKEEAEATDSDEPLRRSVRKRTPRKFYTSY